MLLSLTGERHSVDSMTLVRESVDTLVILRVHHRGRQHSPIGALLVLTLQHLGPELLADASQPPQALIGLEVGGLQGPPALRTR